MKQTLTIIMLTFCVCIAILFMSNVAFSATYYVDYVNGADTNNGTSTSTPWQHCPGDSNATSKANSTTLNPGDTVNFNGGIVYSGTVQVKWSGTSGNVITYQSYGTGQGILDGGGTLNSLFDFTGTQSYVKITNLTIRNGKQAANCGRLIYSPGVTTYIEVSNCLIYNAGSPAVATLSGQGIWDFGNYWLIHGNTLYACPDTAIGIYGSYNQVYNNNISDDGPSPSGTIGTTWGIAVTDSSSSSITGNQIYNNTIHDMYYYDELGPHVDYIISFTGLSGNITNTYVYNNKFYNSTNFSDYAGTAFIFFQTSGASTGTIQGVYIYNNVMFNPHAYNAMQIDGAQEPISNVYIYNNSYDSSSGRANAFLSLSDTINGFVMENNAAKADLETIFRLGLTMKGTVTINNNDWDITGSSGGPMGYEGSGGSTMTYTWAQWQALGYDTNSLGPTSDPLFTNETIGSFNLTLQSSSPCRGAGLNLTSLDITSLDSDLLGDSRPSSGAWDIGAYQSLNPPQLQINSIQS